MVSDVFCFLPQTSAQYCKYAETSKKCGVSSNSNILFFVYGYNVETLECTWLKCDLQLILSSVVTSIYFHLCIW